MMDGRLLVEGDGVNWFVRANELSSGNRGLMGCPGTGDLIKELEYVRQKRASHLTNRDLECWGGRGGGERERNEKSWISGVAAPENKILTENQTTQRCIISVDRAGSTGRLQTKPGQEGAGHSHLLFLFL